MAFRETMTGGPYPRDDGGLLVATDRLLDAAGRATRIVAHGAANAVRGAAPGLRARLAVLREKAAQAAERRATEDALRDVDTATLRDLGIPDRAAIPSVAAAVAADHHDPDAAARSVARNHGQGGTHGSAPRDRGLTSVHPTMDNAGRT